MTEGESVNSTQKRKALVIVWRPQNKERKYLHNKQNNEINCSIFAQLT